MSRFMLEIIKEQMAEPDIPEFVMMHREDVFFLLALVKQAEVLAEFVKHAEQKGSRSASRAMDIWRDLLINEA